MKYMKRVFTVLLGGLTAAVSLFPGGATAVHADNSKKVACVGDSITQGIGNTPYPTRLQDLLGENYEVKNFGLWGTTGCENTGRPYTTCDDSCYQSSLDYQPDIVILMLGTNDGNEGSIAYAEEHYKEDMTKLINRYLSLPSKPTLYLVTSPYAYLPGNAPVNSRIVPMQRELAKELDLPLVDMNAFTENKPELFQDQLHPNDNGYYYLAMCLYREIFGGSLAEVTVKTREKADFRLGAWVDKTKEDGTFTLLCPYGKQFFMMQKSGCEPVYTTVNITGNCTVECEPMQVANVAVGGMSFTNWDGDNVSSAFDGDLFSSWQSGRKEGDFVVGAMFDRSRTLSSVSLLWETVTRAKPEAGSMTVSYTTDGVNWTDVNAPAFAYGEDWDGTTLDTVTFDTVVATGIRITIHSLSDDRYAPKIYEMSAHGENVGQAQITVTPKDVEEPAGQEKKGLPDWLIPAGIVVGAVILAACLLWAIVVAKRKL